jgi:hypothetical protein
MGGTLVSYDAVENGPGSVGLVGKVLGHEDARKRVEVLLTESKERARQLLADHRHLVMALVAALLEHDELIGDEITRVLAQAAEGRPERPVRLSGGSVFTS